MSWHVVGRQVEPTDLRLKLMRRAWTAQLSERGPLPPEIVPANGRVSSQAGFSTRHPWTALEAKARGNSLIRVGVSGRSLPVAVPTATRKEGTSPCRCERWSRRVSGSHGSQSRGALAPRSLRRPIGRGVGGAWAAARGAGLRREHRCLVQASRRLSGGRRWRAGKEPGAGTCGPLSASGTGRPGAWQTLRPLARAGPQRASRLRLYRRHLCDRRPTPPAERERSL